MLCLTPAVESQVIDRLVPSRLTRVGPEVVKMDQVYQDHYLRFTQSDRRLSNLLAKMKNYMMSISALIQTGESLAEQLLAFYRANDRGLSMVAKFCETHKKLKKSFVERFEREFTVNVLDPVDKKIQREIDEVKNVNDERNAAYEEVFRYLKVLRVRTAFKARDLTSAERRLNEAKDRLSLLQNEALSRFNTVERTLTTKLYECVKNLALIQATFVKSAVVVVEGAANAVVASEESAIGYEPYQRRERSHAEAHLQTNSGTEATPIEEWDERYEHEQMDANARTISDADLMADARHHLESSRQLDEELVAASGDVQTRVNTTATHMVRDGGGCGGSGGGGRGALGGTVREISAREQDRAEDLSPNRSTPLSAMRKFASGPDANDRASPDLWNNSQQIRSAVIATTATVDAAYSYKTTGEDPLHRLSQR